MFSVLHAVALVLIRLAVPRDPNDASEWLTDDSKRNAVLFALNVLPFAGIAFLRLIGVVRDLEGVIVRCDCVPDVAGQVLVSLDVIEDWNLAVASVDGTPRAD